MKELEKSKVEKKNHKADSADCQNPSPAFSTPSPVTKWISEEEKNGEEEEKTKGGWV